MNRQKIFPSLIILLLLILQACNLPSNAPSGEPTLDPLVAAQMTITALAERNTPTDVPPTFTALPTLSPTPESTSTPAFTPTPSFAYVTLSEATNCRVGPGLAYDIVDTFLVGQTIEVVGKHPFDNYWYVRSPRNPGVHCWLWGFYATGANLGSVPVLTPPPSPTPAPSFDASFLNVSTCVGWWVRITVKNSGPVAFKSMSLSVRDTVTDVTLSDTRDGFQDVDGCLLSSIIASLEPGASYTIASPSFAADPSGHKLTATLKLCTATGQGGTCTSKTIEFTP